MTSSVNDPQLNVDFSEIKKFEELAARWWDKESEFKPLHDINPLRLEYIDERCGGLMGKRVLDVGCGGGILAESMAVSGADVTGIDMGEAPLSVARLHSLESGVSVNYQRITAEQLAEKVQQGEIEPFDTITCMEMLEHVPDPSSIIAACKAMVKPQGHVFFSTINRNPKSFLFAIVGAEYLLKLLPKGTHEYAKFIRPSELEQWAITAGLNFKHIIGMHFNPLTKRYWLAPNVDVNYLVHSRPAGND